MIGFSNVVTTSEPDAGYSTNVPCTPNLISTFLL